MCRSGHLLAGSGGFGTGAEEVQQNDTGLGGIRY